MYVCSVHSDYSLEKDLLSQFWQGSQVVKCQQTPHLVDMMKHLSWMIINVLRAQEDNCSCSQKRKKEAVCHRMDIQKRWSQVEHSILNSMLSWTLLRGVQPLHLRVRCSFCNMLKSVRHNSPQFLLNSVSKIGGWINHQLITLSLIWIISNCCIYTSRLSQFSIVISSLSTAYIFVCSNNQLITLSLIPNQ